MSTPRIRSFYRLKAARNGQEIVLTFVEPSIQHEVAEMLKARGFTYELDSTPYAIYRDHASAIEAAEVFCA